MTDQNIPNQIPDNPVDPLSKEKEIHRIVHHDMKTPLTAIKGYTSMIQNGDFGPVPSSLTDPLKEIESASERLLQLINNLSQLIT